MDSNSFGIYVPHYFLVIKLNVKKDRTSKASKTRVGLDGFISSYITTWVNVPVCG